ncbi:hypothetical protein [Desulfovibrio sp. ZJ369]|uniref:hypothetical protein n=1 Tax=Desulfovibrio sp. ZJ369 TaxID=2709793 RepID=UPI0013E9FD18|nr:hypothetical protein [Desulfovibrio sp. ZJ369]
MSLKTTLFRRLSRLRGNDGGEVIENEYFQSKNALGPVHAYQKKPCFFGTLPRNSAGERIFVEPFKIVENTQDSANTP